MAVFCVQYYEFPSPHAGSLAIMQQCQALVRQGKDVRLIYVKAVDSPVRTDDEIFAYYGIQAKFKLIGLPVPNFRFREAFFYVLVFGYLLVVKTKDSLVYTRKLQLAAIATFLRLNTILELHTHYRHTRSERRTLWLYLNLLRPERLIKTIAISEVLKNTISQDGLFDKIDVIPSGANLPTSSARLINRTPRYALEVGYTGSLFKVKGIDLILALALELTTIRFHIVGGSPEEVQYWSAKAEQAGIPNLVFYGYTSHQTISAYLNSFDVCLLTTGMPKQYAEGYAIELSGYSSPLKLFDYMAHGKPIVCSDRAEFREILTESTALFCHQDNIDDWIKAIQRLKDDVDCRNRMGAAVQAVFQQQYSWDKRAERVFDSIKLANT